MSIRTVACSTCPLPTKHIGCAVSNPMCDPLHRSAPGIARGGLSGALLRRHLYLNKKTVHIEQAVRSVIAQHQATANDLGVHAVTRMFTHAVFTAINKPARESLVPLLAKAAA